MSKTVQVLSSNNYLLIYKLKHFTRHTYIKRRCSLYLLLCKNVLKNTRNNKKNTHFTKTYQTRDYKDEKKIRHESV